MKNHLVIIVSLPFLLFACRHAENKKSTDNRSVESRLQNTDQENLIEKPAPIFQLASLVKEKPNLKEIDTFKLAPMQAGQDEFLTIFFEDKDQDDQGYAKLVHCPRKETDTHSNFCTPIARILIPNQMTVQYLEPGSYNLALVQCYTDENKKELCSPEKASLKRYEAYTQKKYSDHDIVETIKTISQFEQNLVAKGIEYKAIVRQYAYTVNSCQKSGGDPKLNQELISTLQKTIDLELKTFIGSAMAFMSHSAPEEQNEKAKEKSSRQETFTENVQDEENIGKYLGGATGFAVGALILATQPKLTLSVIEYSIKSGIDYMTPGQGFWGKLILAPVGGFLGAVAGMAGAMAVAATILTAGTFLGYQAGDSIDEGFSLAESKECQEMSEIAKQLKRSVTDFKSAVDSLKDFICKKNPDPSACSKNS